MSKEYDIEKLGGHLRLDRLKALSDGVIAVAITILVLGIDIPTDHNFSEQGLLAFLIRIAFDVLIYAVSFSLIGTFWVQQNMLFHYIRYGNRTLIWLNFLFLFFVTLIPFVSKLRGTYKYEPLTALLFGAILILCGLTLIALWTYSNSRSYLLYCRVEKSVSRNIIWRFIVSPCIISIAAIVVSFFEVHIGMAIFLSTILINLSHRQADCHWQNPEASSD